MMMRSFPPPGSLLVYGMYVRGALPSNTRVEDLGGWERLGLSQPTVPIDGAILSRNGYIDGIGGGD